MLVFIEFVIAAAIVRITHGLWSRRFAAAPALRELGILVGAGLVILLQFALELTARMPKYAYAILVVLGFAVGLYLIEGLVGMMRREE